MGIICPLVLLSGVLPEDRYYEWHKAGIIKQIYFPDTVNVLHVGLINDGFTANDVALSSLITNITEPTVIYFPPGDYKFTTTIVLKSNIIISGSGYKLSKFIFDTGGNADLIRISGKSTKDTFEILSDISKNDTSFLVYNTTNLNIGDFILLFDNDDEKITSDWAKNTTGQVCQMKYIGDVTMNIENKIRRDYKLKDNPRFIKFEPIQNCAIENISIERLDSTVGQTSNIVFDFAFNCFVKCIESINCNFAHIAVNRSSNISLEGSYFHHAFSYGGGGRGYGVMLQSSSGECLVYNNIFKHLRHSMILQSGANGNVIAYNYSIDPYWTDVSLPSNSAGDMVLHGNFPYANLFEGNVCQNIVIDNSHGINGPDNTFFRNRADLFGIFMNTNPASNNQNFIGNEITNTELLKGLYLLSGSGHFEYGNNIRGTITPEGTSDLEDKSYYLDIKPNWYNFNSQFPPIGQPNSLNQFKIEAEERYDQGKFTACDDEIINVEDYKSNCDEPRVYPNPAIDLLKISSKKEIKYISLLTITGKIIQTTNNLLINTYNIESGFYFVKIQFYDGTSFYKPVIIIK